MDEKTWLIIYVVIGWLTAIVIEIQCNRWKRKHDEAITAWTIESNNKDKQILKLQEELENLKAKPVKYAKWVLFAKDCVGRAFYCSNCHNVTTTDDFENSPLEREEYFCPRCGARMDGDS